MADDKTPSTGHTRTESVPAFSPAYAAPEQVAFSRTGPWTDVHGLGLILSELLTDEAPFSVGHTDLHMFEQIMMNERPTPARKGRDVGIFEPVIAKAMALSPKDRWKDAGELLAALDDAAVGKQMALPPSAMAESRTRRRHSRIFAAGLLVLLAGGVVALGIGRTTRRAATVPVVGAGTPSLPAIPAARPPLAAAQAREAIEAPATALASPIPPIGKRKPNTTMDANTRAKGKPTGGNPLGRIEKAPAASKDLFDDIR